MAYRGNYFSVHKYCLESINPAIKTMAWGTLMFSRPENWSEFDINQVNVKIEPWVK
jgi:hypothetical protein